MNERKNNRFSASLIWLLIYHGIVVLIGLGYLVASVVILITDREYGVVLVILVLMCWTTAMIYASVGMMRQRLCGLLAGMICHLLLAILSNVLLAGFATTGVYLLFRDPRWAPLPLLFALIWSPFALFSSWAFFYFRKLRKDLLA